jgi:hypothetical protein
MPEKIGKYRVLERIGRGGMGMIFKAHDPVLDRPVALKVISPDVEVTDELRARFFREAQACARLSHPNIITIYDMGEDDGRLFIVMELLEGEELRQLIAQRRTPPLEDKLSIMVQVCDGLHYAHQKGIVHRDIKPSNIFVQRNGQAKILDFGIAQIANTEGGLTRTGLIMGTLRYISPEQARGRADHRSDIYSAGAVFYELLSMRPPFTAEDPIHLLEQLRTENPVPLDQLDPSIPSELVAITARALRKEPAERFGDFAQMRAALEEVQRGLLEEARQVGARVREQRAEFLQLRVVLAERLGASTDSETIPTVDERGRLAAMQAFERDFARRIEELRAMIARADALAPAFHRATELLEARQFAEAVAELEAIVVDVPEHARALDALARARTHLEADRRQQLSAKLTQDARAALEAGDYTLCLEILNQAAEIAPAAGVAQEISSLRQAAESAVAAREVSRRARHQAEGARARMTQARRAAQAQAETRYAPSVWNEAEAKGAEAEAAFAREAYAEAETTFDETAAAYRRFVAIAGEARQRERAAAEQAREQVAQARHRGQAEGVPGYSPELWAAAEAKSVEGHTALADKAIRRAVDLFNEAVVLFGRAEEAAHEARQRQQQEAEESRAEATQARERARVAGAPRYAQEQWEAVEAEWTEAEQALARQAYTHAGPLLAALTDTYRRLEETAREARLQERDAAERARERMARARQSCQPETAPGGAPALWQEGEAKAIEAEACFAREAFVDARESFDAATDAYRRLEEAVREVRLQERDAAERARGQVAAHRERALASAAAEYARSLWEAAEEKSTAAQAAFLAESPSRAGALFTEAAALYTQAELEAVEARQGERRRAEEARVRAAQGQRLASALDAQQRAPALWNAATQKSAEAETALADERWATAVEALNDAWALYQRAENEAREARERERGLAEQAYQAMTERREAALTADPQTRAPSDWRDAETSAEAGQAALAREAYTKARGAFDQAATLYRRAEERARDAARAIETARADADRARDATAAAHRAAAEAQASTYAPDQWRAGETAEARAGAALSRGEHTAARSFFAEARRHYVTAAQEASIALEAEARRADAMVSDARRLLASGDVAACLGRLNEVLTLRPGHARAQQLRLQAEERERQATAVSEEAIGPGSRSGAERSREASKLARRAAAEAQAPRYAPEQWRMSESAEAEATGALDRHNWGAALSLFAEAERLYTAAARAADLAQTAEAHRADEIVADAERLLAAGEIQATLGRLGEALRLCPGHALAERLRLEAESRLRETEDEASRAETVYLPRAGEPAVPTELSPVNAGGPTTGGAVLAETTVRGLERGKTAPAGASRRAAAPSWLIPRWRGIIVTLGAVAAVVLAIGVASRMYWPHREEPPANPRALRPPQPPSAVPGPPPAVQELTPAIQELAKHVVKAREEAIGAGAEHSPQFSIGREKEREAEDALRQRKTETAERRYGEALASYEGARTEATEGSKAALEAAGRAGDARKKAELAEAPARASSLWNDAEATQRDGTAALDGHRFEVARTLFAKAEKTYQRAEQTAGHDLFQQDLRQAKTAQHDCASAREEAEVAHAWALARATLAVARQKEHEAAAALDSNPAAARQGFSDALALYKQAARQAADRRVALQRDGAEKAQARMTKARRQADKAAASQRAPALFEWGREKERGAITAFESPDYVLAERLFATAEADYESAVREASKAPDRLPSAQSSAEQARRRTVTYRERAVKAGADRLAEGLFRIARAKEAGADKVVNLGSFELATKAYGEAGDLYLDAEGVANARHEADVARAAMQGEKERAGRKTPEYRDASAEEKRGASAYERDQYREAAERFRTAQTLYAMTATKTAADAATSPARTR